MDMEKFMYQFTMDLDDNIIYSYDSYKYYVTCLYIKNGSFCAKDIHSVEFNGKKLTFDEKYTHFITFKRIRLPHFYMYMVKFHCTSPYVLDGETVVEVLDVKMKPVIVNVESKNIKEIIQKTDEELQLYFYNLEKVV